MGFVRSDLHSQLTYVYILLYMEFTLLSRHLMKKVDRKL